MSGYQIPLDAAVLAALVAFFFGIYLGCVAMADHLGRGPQEPDRKDEP